MRLATILVSFALAQPVCCQSVWNQVKRKAREQINKSTQPAPNQQPSGQPSNTGGPSSGSAQANATQSTRPVPNTDLYYWCRGGHSKGASFSQVFHTGSTATLLATVQFAQYLADKYKEPIRMFEVGCTDTQRTEEFSIKSRQAMMDSERTNTHINVIDENWTFTAHPTMEEARAAGQRMSNEPRVFPSGSGGPAAEDAAARATPEYQALVDSEYQNARPACESNEMMSSFYNCACEADVIKAERQKQDGNIARAAGGRGVLHPTTGDLLMRADLRNCAQPDGIKAYAYKRAMATQLLNAPESEKNRVAACTAASFEQEYTSKPNVNIRAVDGIFQNALVICHKK
jgi:hypothetical protein